MNSKSLMRCIAACLLAALLAPGMATAQDESVSGGSLEQQMAAMQQQISALQQQLDALRQEQARQQQAQSRQGAIDTDDAPQAGQLAQVDAESEPEAADGIRVGGAVRFQYSREGYNTANTDRIGDLDFDIFRLDLHGTVGGVELDAQWRWFQYMSAIQHAWIGYHFDDASQVQLGITRLPFGNQPYNAHSYFFSSNYYVGLEDTQQAGVEYIYDGAPWNVQLAFFKNDSMGGIDGYVSNRADSYSYNVVGVRAPGEDISAEPEHPAAVRDTAAARVAYSFVPSDHADVELGVSALRGKLQGPDSRLGHYSAWAAHMNANYKRWNVQAQALRYDYNVDDGATQLAVGAYAFYDTIAARANGYSFNFSYGLPVSWGPITRLDFYNDYSRIYRKSGGLPATFMDVLGVAAAAGDLYTYVDYVTAHNQPFIGGSMAGNGKTEHRLNVNFGFYF